MAGNYTLGNFGSQLALLDDDEQKRAYGIAANPYGDAPEAVLPEDMTVQKERGAPRAAIAKYRDANLADKNAEINLVGDAAQNKADVHTERGALRDEQASEAKEVNAQARSDGNEARQRAREKQVRADRLLDEMQAHLEAPAPRAIERVMGIIGGVLAMGGNEGAAKGAAMMGNLLGGAADRERWANEQNARSQLYNAVTRGIDSDHDSETHEYTIAERVLAANAGYYNAAIEAANERGASKESIAAGKQLQLDLRQKARAGLIAIEEEKAKLGAAAKRTSRENYFYSIPLEQLRQMDPKVLGKDGHKVLTDRNNDDQKFRKGEKDIAGGDNFVPGGASTPSGRTVENPTIYNQLSNDEKKKLHEADDAATSLASNIDALLKLRKENGFSVGVWNTKAYNTAQAINSKIQLAMKKADTLGTLDKGSVDFLEQMTGNPNSWGSAPEEKLRAIKASTLRDVEAKAGASGLSYTPEAKTFQGGAGGGLAGSEMGGAPVTLISPDGKEFKVHPSRAQALRKAGWSDPTVAGGSYIARPADLYAGGGQ